MERVLDGQSEWPHSQTWKTRQRLEEFVKKAIEFTKISSSTCCFWRKFVTTETQQLSRDTYNAWLTDRRIHLLREIVEWIRRVAFLFLKVNLGMLQQGHRERRPSKHGLHQSRTLRRISVRICGYGLDFFPLWFLNVSTLVLCDRVRFDKPPITSARTTQKNGECLEAR